MTRRRLSTSDYPEPRRKALADAAAACREAAGFRSRAALAEAAGVSLRSVHKVEVGDSGVGEKILLAIARVLPGWTQDTPRIILDGGPIPDPHVEPAPPDVASGPSQESDPLEDVDDDALLAIVTDRSKLGTDEHLEALGTLFARERLTKEAFAYGLVVNRKVRQAREAADREAGNLLQSLTERVRSDLSGSN